MTALTALLVLATLFTQVSASLPKTSYFKMVDIWLLFCIMTIFLIIIFHAIIDNYVDYAGTNNRVVEMSWTESDEKQKIGAIFKHGTGGSKAKKLQLVIFVARSLTGGGIALFNVIYWGMLGVSSGLVYQYKSD